MSDALLTDILTVGIAPTVALVTLLMCGRLFQLPIWYSIPTKFFLWGFGVYCCIHLRLAAYKETDRIAHDALLQLTIIAVLALLCALALTTALKASDRKKDAAT